MKCDLFQVYQSGEIYCGRAAGGSDLVGTVSNPPYDIAPAQRGQIEAWSAFKDMADGVAPIFAVMSPSLNRIEASARFRLPTSARALEKHLSKSVTDLFQDLRDAGWRVGHDWILFPDPEGGQSVAYTITVIADSQEESPEEIRPALEHIARAIEETRLGDHVMDPAAGWPPTRKVMSGRCR